MSPDFADVSAEFTITGRTYRDVNPLARNIRIERDTISGVRPPNANTETMHAEFGAMFQAFDEGITGGRGLLVVTGLPICSYCRGDVKTLARHMDLTSLTVVEHDGTVIEFTEPRDLLPIKQGGKSWT